MGINELAKTTNEACEKKGWNHSFVLSEKLLLTHSELSEAYEELRAGHNPQEVYFSKDKQGNDKPEGFGIELADLILRILHITAHEGLDIEALIQQKIDYNELRPYKHGGKLS